MKLFSVILCVSAATKARGERSESGREMRGFERILNRRQLDFDGNGGGINEYLNGDSLDFGTQDYGGDEEEWKVLYV